MKYTLQAQDVHSKARAGVLTTDHGSIETPIFMPVGTAATVKGVHQEELKTQINADIILGNTYHLYLRPGLEVMQAAGGLHKFNGWDRPILTDSGGYQIFSLAHRRKLTEQGAVFSSHIDGSKHLFTPENVMDTQRIIGADIIMAFDECPPWPAEKKYVEKSMHLTHRWLDRCFTQFNNTSPLYGYQQALFPIVQGGTFKDLRAQSAEYIASKDAIGNAIGGLSVGEPHQDMYEIAEVVCDILPTDKPRYLMGVGTPANILECIALGVDMFDCVLPTRNARHGLLYTMDGCINIKNAKWKKDFSALDVNSNAQTSVQHSKSYLHHLFRCEELLAMQIASIHNLAFFLQLVRLARTQIQQGTFAAWKNSVVPNLERRL